ncbi:hypothetical protein JVT61DRAFT_6179 [Boletus reticuloceps]|uniref:Uncharacterized protein n=1 Tax=Boletus reticuloceps TaxID=495285 RepID=A0A8I3A845_9AGAM|nr:hypothetical protein JVT61DRAFT_6179 [Boletus reticuloceps]
MNACESPSTRVRHTHIPGEVEDLGDEGDVLKGQESEPKRSERADDKTIGRIQAHETGVLPQTKPVG